MPTYPTRHSAVQPQAHGNPTAQVTEKQRENHDPGSSAKNMLPLFLPAILDLLAHIQTKGGHKSYEHTDQNTGAKQDVTTNKDTGLSLGIHKFSLKKKQPKIHPTHNKISPTKTALSLQSLA